MVAWVGLAVGVPVAPVGVAVGVGAVGVPVGVAVVGEPVGVAVGVAVGDGVGSTKVEPLMEVICWGVGAVTPDAATAPMRAESVALPRMLAAAVTEEVRATCTEAVKVTVAPPLLDTAATEETEHWL
jgi:hypothetical protein